MNNLPIPTANRYAPDDVIRVIDKDALDKRIKKDGRSIPEIAKAAGISYETIYAMLRRGTATHRSINKLRLALNPRMFYQTLSPDSLQYKNTDKPSNNNTEFKEMVKYTKALSKDFEMLCKKYSTLDVLSLAIDIQFQILSHLVDCDFDLLELHDEALQDIPSIEEV